jgi:hypothetical protein
MIGKIQVQKMASADREMTGCKSLAKIGKASFKVATISGFQHGYYLELIEGKDNPTATRRFVLRILLNQLICNGKPWP